MTTASFTTNFANSTNAGFQTWTKEINDQLVLAGLIRTSDTGQIDFATVSAPGNYSIAGFAIYRFNDTLQSTKPIFLKIEFGNYNIPTPYLFLTVGTGSNGSGTLTGLVGARTTFSISGATFDQSASYPSNVCVTSGFAGMAWKRGVTGATSKGGAYFFISRSVDASGVPTGDCCTVLTCGFGASNYDNCQVIDFLNNAVRPVSNDSSNSCIPQNTITSVVGASTQVYKNYSTTPLVRPIFGVMSVLIADFGANTTFTIIPIGSTVSRTYLTMGPSGSYSSIGAADRACLAMLWE